MDFTGLARDAWRLTWRKKSLWLLGLFAGGATAGAPGGGGGGGGNAGARVGGGDLPDFGSAGPEIQRGLQEAQSWITSHLGLIIAAILLLLLIGLVFTVISAIAQGGLTRAMAEQNAGRPTSLGWAWGQGVRLVWRYLGLMLVLWIIGLAVLAVLGLAVFSAVTSQVGSGRAPRLELIFGMILAAIPLLLVLAILGIVLGVIVTYAQRAIALQDVGPLAALGTGWSLVRRRPLDSLLVWLFYIVLTIGMGIVVVIGLVALAVPFGIVGAIAWGVGGGFNGPFFLFLVGVGIIASLALILLAAFANTYFWTYWTLAYLRLGGPTTEPAGVA
jgi:hypothetical protein